jgi:KAP family P-loop domain
VPIANNAATQVSFIAWGGVSAQGGTGPRVDNPIKTSSEDALQRASLAHSFAHQVRELDTTEGMVIAVLGPWGSGKSSFINLMREEFAADPPLVVIDFNPWLFSGTQQLTDYFFAEVASQLQLKDKDRFGRIAAGLRDYGDILSPIAIVPGIGGWFDRSLNAVRTLADWYKRHKDSSVGTLRERVADATRDLDRPVVVVIDDIDRLTTTEIRDIFRLVRLTASFPNLVYVLAFDRARVEDALSEDRLPGRAYLEKIVQLALDLPSMPAQLLRSRALAELNRAVSGVENLRFDEDRWSQVYFEIVEPLLMNLRDVTRLALSARPVVVDLGSDVETVDLMALEAVWVFRPEMFAALRRIRTDLTNTSGFEINPPSEQATKARFEILLRESGDDAPVLRAVIGSVFPAANRHIGGMTYMRDEKPTWQKAHRLAHSDFLDLYFDRVAPSGLSAFRNAERAFSILADHGQLDAFLTSLAPKELSDTIGALEAYENEYSVDAVVPAATALLDHIADVPEGEGFFGLGPQLVVSRVVLRLLRRIADEPGREAAVNGILAGLTTLSAKFELLLMVGYVENAGHQLVSEAAAAKLEEVFAREVAAWTPARLDREWYLLSVFRFAKERNHEFSLTDVQDPNLIRALLESARSDMRSTTSASPRVRIEYLLAWNTLVDLFGSEADLRTGVALLCEIDGDSDLVLLAERYLGGWRPPEF